MKVLIDVTQEHIDRSLGTLSIHNCPIALAAKDAGLHDVTVGGFTMDFTTKSAKDFKSIPIPYKTSALEFITRPEPFQFTLEIPD